MITFASGRRDRAGPVPDLGGASVHLVAARTAVARKHRHLRRRRRPPGAGLIESSSLLPENKLERFVS